MESTEGFRAAEHGVQKPAADPLASVCIPVKAPVSIPALWDGKKRGEPPGEPVAFPQGLPADAEEQRQFLTEQCIASFRLCLSRFPQHYKSLYRLAFLYTYSKTHRVSGLGSFSGAYRSLKVRRQNLNRLEFCDRALVALMGRDGRGGNGPAETGPTYPRPQLSNYILQWPLAITLPWLPQ